MKPILNDDTTDFLIGNKQITENDIAEWIVKIGRQRKACKGRVA